jgi:hypothetical protein
MNYERKKKVTKKTSNKKETENKLETEETKMELETQKIANFQESMEIEDSESPKKKNEYQKRQIKTKNSNSLYYFKYPEMLILFCKIIVISINIDEIIPLKQFLLDIHVKDSFLESLIFFRIFFIFPIFFFKIKIKRPLMI